MFRGLATRAMFRQALAESQAWTPIESPWTLPGGLVRLDLARGAAGVAEDELVGGQRDRLADRVGRDPLGQRGGDGLGGLLGRALEDRLAHAIDPAVVGLPRAQRLAGEVVLVEQPGQEDARPVELGGVVPVALALDAVADRLAQQRVGLLRADQREQVPGAIGQDDAVDLGVVLDGEEQVVERLVRPATGERGEGLLGRRPCPCARTASRRASPPGWPGESCSAATGCSTSWPRPPLSWIRFVLR